MAYVLRAAALRVVKRNERGSVTSRKRFTQGDLIDPSLWDDEAEFQRLVDQGSVEEVEGDADEAVSDETTPAPSGTPDSYYPVRGAGTEPSADSQYRDESGDGGPVTDEDPVNEGPGEGEDRYDALTYPELQQEAKARTLNAGGSAEDLRDRLREADASV